MNAGETQAGKAYRAHVEQIGPEKWQRKVQRGLIALVLIGFVIFAVVKQIGVPWWVDVGIVFFAGIMFSPDLWKGTIKTFVGGAKDVMSVVRGGGA